MSAGWSTSRVKWVTSFLWACSSRSGLLANVPSSTYLARTAGYLLRKAATSAFPGATGRLALSSFALPFAFAGVHREEVTGPGFVPEPGSSLLIRSVHGCQVALLHRFDDAVFKLQDVESIDVILLQEVAQCVLVRRLVVATGGASESSSSSAAVCASYTFVRSPVLP